MTTINSNLCSNKTPEDVAKSKPEYTVYNELDRAEEGVKALSTYECDMSYITQYTFKNLNVSSLIPSFKLDIIKPTKPSKQQLAKSFYKFIRRKKYKFNNNKFEYE